MSSKQPDLSPKALVSVFDDLGTAKSVVDKLHREGFPIDKIGLITDSMKNECPEIETPEVTETTASTAGSGAMQGAGIGLGVAAGFGAAALALTASPALAVGALIYAGLTGALIGGMGGVDKADLDDTVNLPTPDEYQRLLNEGNSLVVVGGTHEELVRAEEIVKSMPHAGSHIHRLHGHLFHEHPSHVEPDRAHAKLKNSNLAP